MTRQVITVDLAGFYLDTFYRTALAKREDSAIGRECQRRRLLIYFVEYFYFSILPSGNITDLDAPAAVNR